MSRCWFVDDHRHLFQVQRLCELVGVSRARYYRWRCPRISRRELADAWLTNEIYDIHVASRSTYGSPRVFGQLRRNGWRIGEKRVARLMADAGLVGAHSRKRWRRGRPNTASGAHPCESDALVSAGIASLLEPQRGHRTRLQSVQPERPADGQLTRPGRQQKTMLTNTSGSGNLRPQLWTTFCRTTSLSSSGKASLPLKLLRKRPSASLPNRCEHSNGGHDAQQRRRRSLPARFRLI